MKYLNALNNISGVGPGKFKTLLNFFSSGEAIWKSDFKEITQSGIDEKLAQKIITERKNINPDQEWEKLEKENVKIILITDPAYPQLLKEISNAPHLLYVKSNDSELDFNSRPMISVVGSRKFTQYGEQVANSLSRELSQAGIIVVSGMALGIDAIAHKSTLNSEGKTIAILGSGLSDSNIGPKTNFNLSRRIIENGALISDYPLAIQSTPQTFPARNRIMAGMTLGTIVIEAQKKSGTLITANLALDFNREVFAIPGSIFSPSSEGSNNLIKSGAKLVTSINDILEEINLEKELIKQETKRIIPASLEEEIIIKILNYEPMHIDRITKLTKLGTSVVSSNLTILEIRGVIKNVGGQNYILT
ncbi:MAG: DNA-processing protein DprA [Candidatus Moranbacteria bacterium]|nr:DNA-processing protein DprA [Candidatus Moranbacteria bacterium]